MQARHCDGSHVTVATCHNAATHRANSFDSSDLRANFKSYAPPTNLGTTPFFTIFTIFLPVDFGLT